MDQHPTLEDFERLFGKGSHPEDAPQRSQALRHLLAGCPSCQERIRAAHLQKVSTDEGTDQSTGSEYDEVFRRAERDFEFFLEKGHPVEDPPGSLLAELFPSPAEGEPPFSDARFALPLMIKWLVARSYGERHDNPEKMLELAQMARLAADVCSPEVARSRERLADLRGQAWGQLGNALRIRGCLRGAEEALSIADDCLAHGTGDSILEAERLERIASLQIPRRHFLEAITALDEAGEVYEELGERHRFASSLVQKAFAVAYSGETRQGVLLLEQAIPFIDREEDPYLLLTAHHNLIQCYIDLGLPGQALAFRNEVRNLYRGIQDTLLHLRFVWQEGLLLRDLGDLEGARTNLLSARRGFIDQGLSHDAAMLSLDLAEIYKRMGLSLQAWWTAAETLPICRALKLEHEALACLLQLGQAVSAL